MMPIFMSKYRWRSNDVDEDVKSSSMMTTMTERSYPPTKTTIVTSSIDDVG